MNPFFVTDFSISDSLKTVRKSVLIYETIIEGAGKTIINCAIPYFIFNTIFALCTEKTLAINILTPKYIFGIYLAC